MKHVLVLLLFAHCCWASSDELKTNLTGDVTHVATALDHLTVLEFGEPVTMAAAGSTAFQIERHADKVFVKPLKSGASTDLFVWTSSRRFAYELEAPGEVKNMNFAVENRIATPKAAVDNSTQV
ncbi:MAG TPA: TrbG/VirB9 family P-type conjugative transfer protein, partial [Terriglobales bacterium]|nr:TrbG/VirB9 family P-type conjugative transfer protein [Terriglobales bacterium]